MLHFESKCFKAKSSIPNAGHGLFLKQHALIDKGSHLCLYTDHAITEAEINNSGSSRHYAMYIPRKKMWFDAEVENGNNLGRFANQPRVLESLRKIKEKSENGQPELTEEVWKIVEDEIDGHCNAEYRQVADQLVIVAKKNLDPTNRPEELFLNYGGLRSYWINLISGDSNALFPGELVQIVNWLLNSPECNWTQEQRRKWYFKRTFFN